MPEYYQSPWDAAIPRYQNPGVLDALLGGILRAREASKHNKALDAYFATDAGKKFLQNNFGTSEINPEVLGALTDMQQRAGQADLMKQQAGYYKGRTEAITPELLSQLYGQYGGWYAQTNPFFKSIQNFLGKLFGFTPDQSPGKPPGGQDDPWAHLFDKPNDVVNPTPQEQFLSKDLPPEAAKLITETIGAKNITPEMLQDRKKLTQAFEGIIGQGDTRLEQEMRKYFPNFTGPFNMKQEVPLPSSAPNESSGVPTIGHQPMSYMGVTIPPSKTFAPQRELRTPEAIATQQKLEQRRLHQQALHKLLNDMLQGTLTRKPTETPQQPTAPVLTPNQTPPPAWMAPWFYRTQKPLQ